MKKLLLLLLSLTAVSDTFANVVKMDLSEAIKVHMIQAEAVATGQSYKARGLHVKLLNKSGSTIQLKINQGVIFAPADATMQPLVCAGDEMITLQPFKDGQLDLQTFCANADKDAPEKDIAYSYSRMASDTLVKLLQYIKKNVLFDELGQKAVWVVTNNHALAEVYDPARDMQAGKLVDYLASITGKQKPEYFVGTRINEQAGQPVYQPKALNIYAKFEQVLEEPAKLTLGVFDEKDAMIQQVFADRSFGRAGHRFTVQFESGNVPPGKYYIRLKQGERVLQEKMVTVE
ncbi:MAG: hypothetical protein K0R82_455 [Flavipsychrobacter sp.]|jgi:hypothetical protein|nr:hypothetical protein [Flavipsychrobacter sp.]